MIRYEYQCSDPECGHITEMDQKMEDRNNCPPCAKCQKTTSKFVSKMTFQLKGSGWSSDNYIRTKDYADLV